jgi:hypothetical protein
MQISDLQLQQVSLPVSLGGLGLRNLKTHSNAAYFSSISNWSDPTNALEYNSLVSVFPKELTDTSQKSLSGYVDKKIFDNLLSSLDNTGKARLLSASAHGAGAWLTVVPSKSLGLAMNNLQFSTAVKLLLGAPQGISDGTICPSCNAFLLLVKFFTIVLYNSSRSCFAKKLL